MLRKAKLPRLIKWEAAEVWEIWAGKRRGLKDSRKPILIQSGKSLLNVGSPLGLLPRMRLLSPKLLKDVPTSYSKAGIGLGPEPGLLVPPALQLSFVPPTRTY